MSYVPARRLYLYAAATSLSLVHLQQLGRAYVPGGRLYLYKSLHSLASSYVIICIIMHSKASLLLQTSKKKRYRFSLVLDELTRTDNVHYKVILLEFINCVIIYTEDVEDRIRIRNEFYGMYRYYLILLSYLGIHSHYNTLQKV